MNKLEQEFNETRLCLEQEKGKRIAVERENFELKREIKQVREQSEAVKAETEAALMQSADHIKIALGISQGIWGFARMGRSYVARKVAAARVVHREQQLCLLMQSLIDGVAKQNQEVVNNTIIKMRAVIDTINKDGEVSRLQAAETALAYGLDKFEEVFDKLVTEKNSLLQEKSK